MVIPTVTWASRPWVAGQMRATKEELNRATVRLLVQIAADFSIYRGAFDLLNLPAIQLVNSGDQIPVDRLYLTTFGAILRMRYGMRSFLSLFGGTGGRAMERTPTSWEQQIPQLILNQVLEFTGHTINEVINDAGVRYEVRVYYKLYKRIARRCDQLSEQAPQADQGKILV